MVKKIKNHRSLGLQFIEYLISGGAYFWAGYALFAYLWSGLHWSLWWATITSNVFGWTLNYLLQRFWVFNSSVLKGKATQVTGRYIFITLVDFVLNYFILYGLRKAGVTPYIGQFVSAGFFTIWNWFWYRLWVFPEKMSGSKRVKRGAFHTLAHRAHGHGAFTG